jgi:hypothetical protein
MARTLPDLRERDLLARPPETTRRARARLARGLAAALLVLGLALPAAADDRPEALVFDTPGPFPTLGRDYRPDQRRQIVIEDQALSPRTIVIWQGQEINWLSMARSTSRIVFEREVARSLVCHSLVNFELAEDELRSGDLHAGDRASFCELAPGQYRYRVVRNGHGEAQGLAGARRLNGWIVVRPRPVAAR